MKYLTITRKYLIMDRASPADPLLLSNMDEKVKGKRKGIERQTAKKRVADNMASKGKRSNLGEGCRDSCCTSLVWT